MSGWLAAHLPRVRPGRDFVTRVALAPGSTELRSVFARGLAAIAANDTSGASGYAPLSPTEEIVLGVEQFLNGPEFKARLPRYRTGREGLLSARGRPPPPHGGHADARRRDRPPRTAYFRRKEEVLAALTRRFHDAPFAVDWRLNNLDAPGHGSDGVYLVLTGTSAEDADSGQVGRGNHANGLIAFARPTGGEATAGKNPVAHTGKIYSVLSHRLARLIHARRPELLQVNVHLASRIGEPVDRPWTGVQVILPDACALSDVDGAIREVVEAEIARLPEFCAELVRGAHPVC